MRHLNYLLLLLVVACGNPHLNSIDKLGSKNIPIIGKPEVLNLLGLHMDDGLNFRTKLPSISKVIEITNLDIEKEWSVEMMFEKGSNFRFKGGSYPGTEGTCGKEIKGSEKCKLDLEFFADASGFHADNLDIAYVSLTDEKDIRTFKYPLRGERYQDVVKEKIYKVTVKTLSGLEILDFGKSDVKDIQTSIVIIKNEGTELVTFEVKFEFGINFNFTGKLFPGSKGSCKSELAPGEECRIEVTFEAQKIGLEQDKIIIDYKEGIKTFNILGEKLPNKKRGPLVSSEVFSSHVDFGKVKTGLIVNKQFEIQNLGETSYGLKSSDITGENFSFSGGKFPGKNGTCSDILLPGSCLIELAYSPSEVKKDKGNFKLQTIEGDSVELTLGGEGILGGALCESFNEYLIIPEKTYPAKKVIFPYLRSHPDTFAKLDVLYGTQVNGYIKSLDRYTVSDGMVYLTFKLPKIEGEIINMNFGVKVLKVIQDNYKDTESLCLSSEGLRKCSGHEFSLASWQKLKNPKFWDVYQHPVSERYEKQFVSGEYKCGAFRCMDLNTQYELSDIFELSMGEMATLRKEGTFSLIFSDDTRMHKMPRIYVKTKVQRSCE